MKLTLGLSTIHDLRPGLFVGVDVSRQTAFPAIKPGERRGGKEKRGRSEKRKKKSIPLCGNLLTRRAFDFQKRCLWFLHQPLAVYSESSGVDARRSCGHVRARWGDKRRGDEEQGGDGGGKGGREASTLTLIMRLCLQALGGYSISHIQSVIVPWGEGEGAGQRWHCRGAKLSLSD